VIPAACMKVARPRCRAQLRSQLARSRLVSSRGRSVPPASELISAVVTFGRRGSWPPVTRPSPAKWALTVREALLQVAIAGLREALAGLAAGFGAAGELTLIAGVGWAQV
jgi:hypothetical protein